MTHVMYVLLIALFSVSPSGSPSVEYEVHSVHMREKACWDKAAPMLEYAKQSPKLDVQCVPVRHSMIW